MEEQILECLPLCDIGQITKEQKKALNKLIRYGKVYKTKWYWNSMCIGNKKTWYHKTINPII